MLIETKQTRFTSVDDLARSLEPRARRAFLDAIEALKGSTTFAALERAIRSGSLLEVQQALGLDRLEEELGEFRGVILDAVHQGGEIAMAEVGYGIRFDITDTRALQYVQTHAGRLIREVSAETRAGVVELIEAEFRSGIAPQRQARRIRDRVGLTAYQERIARNYEETLRAAVRGEATWVEVDAYRLNPIRGPGGLQEARIDAAVARYRERMIAFRADTIARTETLTAAHAGQQEAWQQLYDKGALPPTVAREWIVSADERLCPICAPLEGERAPLGGSFPGGFDGPPAHPNCRCTVGLVGL